MKGNPVANNLQNKSTYCIHLRMVAFFVLSAAVLLTGCWFARQWKQAPSITFDRLDILDATLVDATYAFTFTVNNPNDCPLPVSNILYELRLNNHPLTKGDTGKMDSIPAKSPGKICVTAAVAYLDVFDSVIDMTTRRATAYDLTLAFAFGPFKIPFKVKGVCDLPQMPKLYLKSITIKQASIFGATLDCALGIDNPNAFDLRFTRMNYHLKLAEKPFAKACIIPSIVALANSEATIVFPLDVSFVQIGHSAHPLLMCNNADYRFEGRLAMHSKHAGQRLIPFSFGGNVPFFRKQ